MVMIVCLLLHTAWVGVTQIDDPVDCSVLEKESHQLQNLSPQPVTGNASCNACT